MTATANIRTVFIIDDDEGVRRGLERLIRSAGWQAESHATAGTFLDRLPFERVGCVLLDVEMPGMTGPELQERMLALGVSLPIIYLTGHADVPMSIRAMKQGALDILLKPVEEESVLSAIRTAIERHESIDASGRQRLAVEQRLARLSPREHQVMVEVISGRLNKQIAGDFGITEKTVKAHRARVMEKLETRSVAALVRLCAVAGISVADASATEVHRAIEAA
jgi:two-component system, LuxR family, response regulator FixJ